MEMGGTDRWKDRQMDGQTDGWTDCHPKQPSTQRVASKLQNECNTGRWHIAKGRKEGRDRQTDSSIGSDVLSHS